MTHTPKKIVNSLIKNHSFDLSSFKANKDETKPLVLGTLSDIHGNVFSIVRHKGGTLIYAQCNTMDEANKAFAAGITTRYTDPNAKPLTKQELKAIAHRNKMADRNLYNPDGTPTQFKKDKDDLKKWRMQYDWFYQKQLADKKAHKESLKHRPPRIDIFWLPDGTQCPLGTTEKEFFRLRDELKIKSDKDKRNGGGF